MELPGYYYNAEKRRYFRILPDHAAPTGYDFEYSRRRAQSPSKRRKTWNQVCALSLVPLCPFALHCASHRPAEPSPCAGTRVPEKAIHLNSALLPEREMCL